MGGRPPRVLSRQMLAEIIEPRMDEILTLIRREIQKSGMEDLLPAGVVLTGGASMIEGAEELAEGVLQLPVRLGVPDGIGGLVDMVNGPMYSTAVGLVTYAMKLGVTKGGWGMNGVSVGPIREKTARLRNFLAGVFK